MKLSELCYVYAKMKWMKTFKAFDLDGFFVARLIYCSMLENSEENQIKLQRLADRNKTAGWIFQLRMGDNILFETK